MQIVLSPPVAHTSRWTLYRRNERTPEQLTEPWLSISQGFFRQKSIRLTSAIDLFIESGIRNALATVPNETRSDRGRRERIDSHSYNLEYYDSGKIQLTSSIFLGVRNPIPPISITFLRVGLAISRKGSELVSVNAELAMISCSER